MIGKSRLVGCMGVWEKGRVQRVQRVDREAEHALISSMVSLKFGGGLKIADLTTEPSQF